MTIKVDSYRYLPRLTQQLVKSWIARESPREIPWTPLSKPIRACTVALISSGGVALKSDRPFDQEGERNNPWWGDPSYRIIPGTATEEDVRIYHLHINPDHPQRDLNCLLPIGRLNELEAAGDIGCAAPAHYSIMGYILQPETLIEETTPAMIGDLREDEVDVVILVPA